MKTDIVIPRIEFKYSPIYDEVCRGNYKHSSRYPDREEIITGMEKGEAAWREHEEPVLTELSDATGLPWKDDNIHCYVVGWARPISDPLTLPTYRSSNKFVDVLTHETIHRLFCQEGNLEKFLSASESIQERHSDETKRTNIHIPLYAVHSHIYQKFFGEERLENDISDVQKWDKSGDYKRAWDIVQREGHENLMEEFLSGVK